MSHIYDSVLSDKLNLTKEPGEYVPQAHASAVPVTERALLARARIYEAVLLLLLVTWAGIEIAINNPLYAQIQALGATCVPYSWDDGVGILAERGILVFNLLFIAILAGTRLGFFHRTGGR